MRSYHVRRNLVPPRRKIPDRIRTYSNSKTGYKIPLGELLGLEIKLPRNNTFAMRHEVHFAINRHGQNIRINDLSSHISGIVDLSRVYRIGWAHAINFSTSNHLYSLILPEENVKRFLKAETWDGIQRWHKCFQSALCNFKISHSPPVFESMVNKIREKYFEKEYGEMDLESSDDLEWEDLYDSFGDPRNKTCTVELDSMIGRYLILMKAILISLIYFGKLKNLNSSITTISNSF